MDSYYPARADIDLDAVKHNFRVVESLTSGKHVMAIVKADGYGHGRAQVAQAALSAGADFLGVAQLGEALSLRTEIGSAARILCWIYGPGAPLASAVSTDIDISVGAMWALDEVVQAARKAGKPARVHLKVDTGMARGGFNLSDIAEAASRAASFERSGDIRVVGLWSHLARGDEPSSDFTDEQVRRFDNARIEVSRADIDVELHHLAASSGIFWHPKTHFDMVRPGAALYGISPNPRLGSAQALGLQAAMEVSAELIVERKVPAHTGISYGHLDVTENPTNLAVVPLGYGDGIDRQASNCAPVQINGVRTRIAGRVCMDQFVVRVPEGTKAGDRAVLFGDAVRGLPTADEWAQVTQTIGWEVVTRLGPRVPRYYHGTSA